jgi:osmotically-inducible protein OsmY
MRVLSVLVLLLLVTGTVTAAFAADKASDDQIYDQVRRRLAADRDVKGGGIDVDVKDGVVTLRGKVREPRQKTRAERIAHKVKGVTQVVNELQVVPTAP